VDLSNVDPNTENRLMGWSDRRMLYQSGNQLWHTDSSFKPVPAMASLLSGREVPAVGGETEFVSMRHAYATLPEETRRRLEGRVVVHSILYSRSTIAKGLFDPEQEREQPPVRQALVRANPVNGRKSVYIGSHAWYVEGMDYDESRSLLDELLAHTTRPEHVYQHRWHAWDLVMWDNRCVLHRGRPWDATLHRRVMRRTTVAGEGPTADPPFASRSVAWDGIIPEGVGVQRRRTLDDAVPSQSRNLLGRVAQLAQDLVGVLAVLGRGATNRAGRARERRRQPLHPDLTALGMAHGPRQVEMLHLRVLEDLPDVVDRPRGDARTVEGLDPLGARPLHEHLVQLGVHRLAVP